MGDAGSWSWQEERRPVGDLDDVRQRHAAVHEFAVGPDGETIAAPVVTDAGAFRVWTSGQPWEEEYERVWHLRFAPDGRLTALVQVDDEWTVAVDGQRWPKSWEFAWNTTFSGDGSVIAVQIKDNMAYSVAVNGEPWESRFHSSRALAVSEDGSQVAAAVQVEPLAEGDIFGFMEGTWSVAVNGDPWPRKFINVYAPVVSPNDRHVAAEVRLDICEYTLAED
jgi:hypothetical protein